MNFFRSLPFPVTSNIWWTAVVWLLILVALMIFVGEMLALAGVKNFSFFTYFIRYELSHRTQIIILVFWVAFTAFLVWHFGWGHGIKTGPNHGL